MLVTIATSERSCGLAGVSGPREACTLHIESSTVTNCGPLACSSISVRPSVGRISAVVAAHQVGPVQLRRDLHGQRRRPQGRRRHVGVGCGLDEVAAEPDEDAGLAVAQRPDGVDGVVAVFAGRVEPELGLQRVQELGRRSLPDAHGAIALHVGVPADREQPGPGLPMFPCAKATLQTSLITATELWCWVRPIAQQKTVALESRSICAASVICSRLRPVVSIDEVPVQVCHVRPPRVEAGGVCGDEVLVQGVPLARAGAEGLEQRQVAVDLDRQVQVGQVGAVTDDAARVCGLRKLSSPASRSGLIVMILAPFASRSPARSASGDGWCRGSGRPG